MTYSISGKTAIVTGAAHGIGLAVARHFVERGANVMFADIDEDKLEAEIGDQARAEGPVRLFTGDLCQKLSVANLVSATVDAFDRIDILVNASRQIALSNPLCPEETPIDDMLRQNVLGGLKLTQAVAKRMVAQAERDREAGELPAAGIGSIVNLSTVAGQCTQPEFLAYSIAMAALDQATRSLAVAYAPHRIRVNGVAFGSVMSMSLQAGLRDHPGWRERIVEATPLGRIAPANELAEAVQFLASGAAGFVTGQILTVDGGRTLLDPVRGAPLL
ncbi:SDR family NAD(P)-dependent oxidoreductase [Frigidibacter oleivorans]|uniref:SDR family NAD(P)-dependent oxidoreductase n=1 Tax=Frigidibacter oleivorans TaxID=2487129 RepID=UPI000F8D9204|nr:SDR family oxidoreductase [Frigidibacter oleivorans]